MRVLFLNQTFHPDVAATAQQASDLAVRLVERGHDVTVVCGRRAYDNPAERYARSEVWRGVRIRRIPSCHLGKASRWRRAADFGSFLASCAFHLGGLPRFDVVVAMTSPPLISWLGAAFVTLKGGRFVFWVMDLNPDEALAAGWLRRQSFTTKGLVAMLGYGLRRATTVVALDRFMADRIQDKGVSPHKIVTLPPWPREDVVRYDAEGRTRFRQQHGLDGKFVVMYSGNHSPCHPLDTVLEAARRLRDRPDIVFCFVGGGSEFPAVKRFVTQHQLGNVTTLPYQPLDGLAASLSAADLHVVVMGAPFVGIVHPCKVYNILTLGIPMLYVGPPVSHVMDLAPRFVADHGDADAVVQHVESASDGRCDPANGHRPEADVAADYRRDRLLANMAFVLERAAFGPAPRRVGGGVARPIPHETVR